MAIKAFSGGISQQPLPDFLLTDIQDGDFLQFNENVKAFINIRNLNIPTDLSQLTDINGLIGTGGNTDLTNYYTKTQTDALIPTNVSAFTNDVPYLTSTDLPDTSSFIVQSQLVSALAPYATQEWVQEQIAAAELDGENVDLSVYITQSELTTQLNALPNVFSGDYNDLTNKPDLTSYITQADLNTTLANYQLTVDLSAYVTQTELDTDLADYYTKTETDALIPTMFSGDYNDLTNVPTIVSTFTNDAGYVTQSDINTSLQPYALTANIPSPPDLTNYALKSEIPSLTGYATTAYVDSRHQDLSLNGNILSISNGNSVDLSGLAGSGSGGGTGTQGPQGPTGPQGPQGATGPQGPAGIDGSAADLTGYATETYVQTEIASATLGGNVDLSTYTTDTELATALTDYYTQTQLDAMIPTDVSDLTDTTNLLGSGGGGGSVDLTGYATETYVNQQIASASIGGIADLDDLNDVAIGSLPQSANASEFYLLEYNPVNQLWESKDFGNIFATQAYVSSTVATALTDGDINLDGYATEQFVEQKITEIGTHFSGDYFDLTNRPILFSGDYGDLTNVPAGNQDLRLQLTGQELQLLNIEPDPDTVISTVDLSSLGSAIGQNISYDDLQDLPNLFSGDYLDLVNRPQLFSGNYTDLSNKPYIPSIAGLATEAYVDNRLAEPEITGDRIYTDDIEYRAKTSIVAKPSTEVCARHDNYVMCVETADSTETEALLVGGDRIVIEQDSTIMYEAHIVGTTNTEKFGLRIKGVADDTGGTLSLIGSPSREILTDNASAWTADVAVDTANNSLKLTVVGSDSTDVHWTLFVECNVVKR